MPDVQKFFHEALAVIITKCNICIPEESFQRALSTGRKECNCSGQSTHINDVRIKREDKGYNGCGEQVVLSVCMFPIVRTRFCPPLQLSSCAFNVCGSYAHLNFSYANFN